MKYFISSLGFLSKNVTSILNKNILLLKKRKKKSLQLNNRSKERFKSCLYLTYITVTP